MSSDRRFYTVPMNPDLGVIGHHQIIVVICILATDTSLTNSTMSFHVSTQIIDRNIFCSIRSTPILSPGVPTSVFFYADKQTFKKI